MLKRFPSTFPSFRVGTEMGKVIVKARLCAAGMKWKGQGVAIVLSLRTLGYSQGRW